MVDDLIQGERGNLLRMSTEKEEDERDHKPGLFTTAKVNEIKKLFRFGAVEAVRAADFRKFSANFGTFCKGP